MVWVRVIDETWDGYCRENDMIKELSELTHTSFKHSSPNDDERYAVDGFLFEENEMLCGIQIKPQSYRTDSETVEKARKINEKKNETFSKTFRIPVFYVYYDKNGLVNREEILFFVNYTKESSKMQSCFSMEGGSL